ncbi:Hypothetical predicted protein [Mytilus galloprovincialis]|uniref:C-type lectin domain-containing protein n=1 Tax=Mytilus galloprovincialis TaxID=29158 RepID=A0A8B6DRZ6_MYTGA|nr:Hypothetical predicted protein [Mytilus galloprovincialis]
MARKKARWVAEDLFSSTWLQYENKCFYLSHVEKSWDGARLTCENNYGSRLVEVGSSFENDFLKNEATVYGQSYWLGGSDTQTQGTWMWVSSQTTFTFTDWFEGEPSSYPLEDCVRMTKPTFKWGDFYCSTQYRFICEQK